MSKGVPAVSRHPPIYESAMARRPGRPKQDKNLKAQLKRWQEESEIGNYKLNKHAKFNWDFVDVAARLTAAGCTSKDLGYIFGVKEPTIESWKKRYPEFHQAVKCGKEVATQSLIASGLKAANGYDYVEEEVVYETVRDEEGNETERPYRRKITKKHQPANPVLTKFFLINMSPDYTNENKLTIDNKKSVNLKITGEGIESEKIKMLAGKLMQEEAVDAEFDEDRHTPELPEDSTSDSEG